MKSQESKHLRVRGGPARPTARTAIAELDKAPPRGQSLRDMLAEIEQDHPDLAAEAPISSAAVEAGEMVRSARLAAGRSQRDLAEAAGMHQSAISALERGEGKEGPSYRKLRDIALALGLRLAFVPSQEAAERGETALDTFEEGIQSLHAPGSPIDLKSPADCVLPLEKTTQMFIEYMLRVSKMLQDAGGPEQANLMLLSPGSVISENSSVRRRVTRVGREGGFIHGGSFTADLSVSLGADVEVQIVNTGAQPLLAVSIPEPERKPARSAKT